MVHLITIISVHDVQHCSTLFTTVQHCSTVFNTVQHRSARFTSHENASNSSQHCSPWFSTVLTSDCRRSFGRVHDDLGRDRAWSQSNRGRPAARTRLMARSGRKTTTSTAPAVPAARPRARKARPRACITSSLLVHEQGLESFLAP